MRFLFGVVLRLETFAPAVFVVGWEISGETVAERFEVFDKVFFRKSLGAEVDAHVVILQVGDEYCAVGGQDVASDGSYCVDALQLDVGLVVPVLGIDYRSGEKFVGDCSGK